MTGEKDVKNILKDSGLPWELDETGEPKITAVSLDKIFENSYEIKNGIIPGNCREMRCRG